jgi:photosystem II stability/assembly factor-like uncharacterized protein
MNCRSRNLFLSALFKTSFAAGLLAAPLVSTVAHASSFIDPLDAPAAISSTPAALPMLAVAQAGSRLVAVGARGAIIVSNTLARSWVQAPVPVQSDLVAVQFPDSNSGWACGHDGVILHTLDGGYTWTKRLDGVSARAEFEAYYGRRISAGDETLAEYLRQIQLNYDNGPSLPWLGVWFTDAETGYVVGSFGDIAFTSDGGQTWLPWLDHIDNPNFLDLNAIGDIGGQLYIVGEQGMVYELNAARQKFEARPTGYAGSLFGLTGTAETLIVFGLRGTIFRSVDQGKTWTQSSNPSASSIMNGTVLPNGLIILVDVDGGVLLSDDGGKSFRLTGQTQNMPLTDVIDTGPDALVLTGLGGVRDAAQN